MPMMAAYEQNDARDSASVLATRTLEGLEGLDKTDSTPLRENAINNMYRLLQGYRSHGFFGYAERPRAEEDVHATSTLASADRSVGDLTQALDSAFKEAFGDQDPGTAIDDMKAVLRAAAYPGPEPFDHEAAQSALRFFKALLGNLRE